MIEQKYLLVINLPFYIDERGGHSLEELWHKDFVKHLAYLRNLTLAAPSRRETPPAKVIAIDHDAFEGTLSYVELPPCRSMVSAIATLPMAAVRLWRAIGNADIVHVGAGGWPISYAWIAAPMAKLRGKYVLTIVESGGWRLGFRRPLSVKGFILGIVFETMSRVCVNISDLAIFTHSGYLESMLSSWRRHCGHVISASWIDEDNIVSRANAESLWREKLADPDRPLRLVFAANLLPSKGVKTLLEALDILDQRGLPLQVSMYGQGPLYGECVEAGKRLNRGVNLEMRGVLAYGDSFFEMLRGHDLAVLPSLSDEQPRLIFDCFSQSLPVIVSDTLGLRQCVTEGQTGRIIPVGDVRAWADALVWASSHRDRLRDFGINALDVAHALTHDQMHARRADLIRKAMKPGTGTQA